MQNDLTQLRKLSALMDSRFEGPFGLRFGLDGIVGLFPIFGDLVTTGVSFYILAVAWSLGCSPPVILRMGLNILVENLVDMIPIFGNLFDFYWKSNVRNVALLERALLDPRKTSRSSIVWLILIILLLTAVLIGVFVLAYVFLIKLFRLA